MLGNLVEIFVYSSVYVLIVILGMKVIGASISADFEKRIIQEGAIGLSIIISSFFIGVAIIFFSVAR